MLAKNFSPLALLCLVKNHEVFPRKLIGVAVFRKLNSNAFNLIAVGARFNAFEISFSFLAQFLHGVSLFPRFFIGVPLSFSVYILYHFSGINSTLFFELFVNQRSYSSFSISAPQYGQYLIRTISTPFLPSMRV